MIEEKRCWAFKPKNNSFVWAYYVVREHKRDDNGNPYCVVEWFEPFGPQK